MKYKGNMSSVCIVRMVLILFTIHFSLFTATAQPKARRVQQQQVEQQQKKKSTPSSAMTRRAQISFPTAVDMPEDVVWRRDIYREINLEDDANAGLYYPVLWYSAVTGIEIKALQQEQITYGLYSMNEFKDIFHVFCGDISMPAWLKQYRQCTGFAYKSKQDPKPVREKMAGALLRKIRRIR